MKQDEKLFSPSGGPSVASQFSQAPIVKQTSSRFGNVARSYKAQALEPSTTGLTDETGVQAKQLLESTGEAVCPASGASCEVYDKPKLCPFNDRGVVTAPLDIDIERKGKKRSSRRSRRTVESTIIGGAAGTISSGDASDAAIQRIFCKSSQFCGLSLTSTPNPNFRVKQRSIPLYTRSPTAGGGGNMIPTKPDIVRKIETNQPEDSSSTLRTDTTGRLQYVRVKKEKLKQVSALTTSEPNDSEKLPRATDRWCSLKAAAQKNDKAPMDGQSEAAHASRSYFESAESRKGCREGNGKNERGCFQVDRGDSQDFFFLKHWSSEQVRTGLLVGQIHKAFFRVNPYNRTEAYVTVEGVPVDIRIDGFAAQNRAVDGDVVAVEVDRPANWAKLKSNNTKQFQAQFSNQEAVASTPGTDSSQFLSLDGRFEVAKLSETEMLEASGSNIAGIQSKILLGESSVLQDIEDRQDNEHEMHVMQEQMKENAATASAAVLGLAALVTSFAGKRPVGRVVAILDNSPRRETITGWLELHPLLPQLMASSDGFKEKCLEGHEASQKALFTQMYPNSLLLNPLDSRLPKMVVFSSTLPPEVLQRWQDGDLTLEHELFAARIESWKANSSNPRAVVEQSLGHGGKIKTQTAAILFENSIHGMDFPSTAMACLPNFPWKIPNKEIKRRRDLREFLVFSIDPPSAKDIDDALSIKQLDNGLMRVGVHIADVSYFVKPSSPLDKEAQSRSTSVYLIRQVLPMLPAILCEQLCSLNPGVDRLAFSVIWDIDPSGEVVDQWMGRTVIQSCANLTYADAQAMIDGSVTGQSGLENLPKLHGKFMWQDVVSDVSRLNKLAKVRRKSRFGAGALRLENSKLEFSLDAEGVPFESRVYEHKDSNYVVEEFMLLANMSVAAVISKAFPDSALLRRHPEPNLRKLQELEDICQKSGFKLDISSSGALHLSLEKIRETVKDDPTLYSILMLYATKPMQLAKYFSTGELKDKEGEWAHYALAVPFYTHFTSPIRRYPDLVVHRTLAAVLEAEEILSRAVPLLPTETTGLPEPSRIGLSSFSGPFVDMEAACSAAARTALDLAALKHRIPRSSELALVASHCNERKLACRNVAEACTRLYLWAMLKNKQGEDLVFEGRVVAVGPKFVSVYISGIAMERRIYYEEAEGLSVEWFGATGTVVLDICPQRMFHKKHSSYKNRSSRTVADVAMLVNPTGAGMGSVQDYDDVVREVEEILTGRMFLYDENPSCMEKDDGCNSILVEPAVLPLTLKLFSTVPVSLHPTGDSNKPVDVGAKLYLSSYQMLGE